MDRIERLADTLADDDGAGKLGAQKELPPCDATGDCKTALANALGSHKGYVPSPPDHAACATVAVRIARDHQGQDLADADLWIGQMKAGHGAGPDALRLAVSASLAGQASALGQAVNTEAEARQLMRLVAQTIPGACITYARLGAGDALTALPAEQSPEHASCVHRDLTRREGPGASYGSGVFRAAEGAAAVLRETERALRLGLTTMTGARKSAVERRLKFIEEATKKLTLARQEAPGTAGTTTQLLLEAHADAGVLMGPRDAGAPKVPLRPRSPF
jgi:hypothetical protein